MLNQIALHLKKNLADFPQEDSIIFKNQRYQIHPKNFFQIYPEKNEITFIDGGQAEIITSSTFCISFIRIVAVQFPSKHVTKKEFFLLTTTKTKNNQIFYESKLFGDMLINELDLYISSEDTSIKIGRERASITSITNIARRLAELSLASSYQHVLLDGSLDNKYNNEEKYIKPHFSALAKSSSLFTTSGNSPSVLLNKLGPEGLWKYELNQETSFVKLHPNAKHIFRFDGNKTIISSLISNSKDALFLGYPYGLILADTLARVSNSEKESLRMKFFLNNQNKDIIQYLQTSNAHSILDSLSF